MSERAVPFHCPYCGGEDLWPHESVDDEGRAESKPGAWECHACLRAFRLSMLGRLRRPAGVAAPAPVPGDAAR